MPWIRLAYRHGENLLERGLSEERIRRNQYRSMPETERGPFPRGVAGDMNPGITPGPIGHLPTGKPAVKMRQELKTVKGLKYTKYTWNPACKGVDDYLLSCAAGA